MCSPCSRMAYRILDDSRGVTWQDCDDDGESAAGGRLLHLLQVGPVSELLAAVSILVCAFHASAMHRCSMAIYSPRSTSATAASFHVFSLSGTPACTRVLHLSNPHAVIGTPEYRSCRKEFGAHHPHSFQLSLRTSRLLLSQTHTKPPRDILSGPSYIRSCTS